MLMDLGPEATILAGGTDLLPKMKRRQIRCKALVDIRLLKEISGLRRTGENGGEVHIGSGVPLAEAASHPLLEEWDAVRQAAAQVATPSIRNAATLGGNLCQDTRCIFVDRSEEWRAALGFCLKSGDGAVCHAAPGADRCRAVFSGDIAPALMAAAARVRLCGGEGTRLLPIEELYRDDGRVGLTRKHGEILTEVLLDRRSCRESVYLKLRRRDCFDFALLGVAIGLLRDQAGTVLQARIALGGVSPVPFLAWEASRTLLGNPLTPESVAEAASICARLAKPISNADASPSYRKRMAAVLVARGLEELLRKPS